MQKLETRDGALLCGDDLLKDVIDDKEILGLNIFCFRIQTLTIFIVAVFDDFDEEEDTLEGIISVAKGFLSLHGICNVGL